jgi:uncharacterized protein YjbJ (UPF0337 family)
MNDDQLKGLWKQFHGLARSRWGRLTDDDWATAAGNVEVLIGKLQERYGDTREAARERIDALYEALT